MCNLACVLQILPEVFFYNPPEGDAPHEELVAAQVQAFSFVYNTLEGFAEMAQFIGDHFVVEAAENPESIAYRRRKQEAEKGKDGLHYVPDQEKKNEPEEQEKWEPLYKAPLRTRRAAETGPGVWFGNEV